jgi:hypothetical protein
VHGDDVGVREARHGLGLGREAGHALGGPGAGKVWPQQLERHLAVELRVVRGVDDRHRSGAHQLEHHVATHLGSRR